MTKVLIADDHKLFREGIKAVLEGSDIEIAGEASTGGDAVEFCRKLKVDIAILDIDMPQMNGLIAARAISRTCPDTRILILSMLTDETAVTEALKSGASGYLLKDSAVEELRAAIKAVMDGETYLSPRAASVVVRRISSGQGDAKSALDLLSDREKEVLQLTAEGKSVKQIAELLSLSPKTVENHRANIMKKLDFHDIPSLVKFAIRTGLTGV